MTHENLRDELSYILFGNPLYYWFPGEQVHAISALLRKRLMRPRVDHLAEAHGLVCDTCIECMRPRCTS